MMPNYALLITEDADQQCFCREGNPQNCPPKGTWDNFPCMGNAMIVSKPHFLDADPSLLKNVKGMKPVRKIHDNSFEFELNTGSPVSVKNRIQFSLQIEKIDDFDLMENIKPVIIPLVWVEESLELPEKLTNVMFYGIYVFRIIATIVMYLGILVGCIGLAYSGYRIYNQIIPNQVRTT